jgi:hypothetical protein
VKAKKQESKRYRAVVTVEFTAESRDAALAKAKELIPDADAKVKVQEAATSWLTFDSPTA